MNGLLCILTFLWKSGKSDLPIYLPNKWIHLFIFDISELFKSNPSKWGVTHVHFDLFYGNRGNRIYRFIFPTNEYINTFVLFSGSPSHILQNEGSHSYVLKKFLKIGKIGIIGKFLPIWGVHPNFSESVKWALSDKKEMVSIIKNFYGIVLYVLA